MKKQITVQEAINKGQQTVNYPVFAVMIIGIAFSIFLFNITIHQAIPTTFLLLSIFIFPWLYWSFAIVYWRIWAFTNVRNVHELKRKAIEGKLIWPDESIFNKTEIRNSKQQRILDQLELKFKLHDIHEYIHDNESLPVELKIYNSKSAKYLQTVGAFSFIIFGLYEILIDEFITGLLILGMGAFLFYEKNKISLVEPQIIISNKGIQLANSKFISWYKISYIRLELRGSGKHAKWNLVYKKKGGKEYRQESLLDNLDCSVGELEDYIKIYQQRNRKFT